MVSLWSAVRRWRGAAAAALAALAGAAPAGAQGAFQTLSPFFGGETASRAFFGSLALSAEAAVRDTDLLGLSAPGATSGFLSLAGRLDYALLPQVDLSLVADLSGGVGRGPLGLSWIVVKPYWHNERTDYAVRVAVDPASEGGLGFRRTDVTFLASTAQSPALVSDLTIGLRRVRTGYADADSLLDAELVGGDVASASLAFARADGPARTRVVGQELRASWSYNVLFDPAGSRLSLGLAAEAGDYALLRSDATAGTGEDRIRSGTGWMQFGIEWSRPDYQLAPFVRVPLATWADVEGEPVRYGPRPEKLQAGLRVTLR